MAGGALGIPGDTERAAMEDDLVREDNPLLFWNDLHEVLFDLLGVGVFGQVEAGGDALDVRIDNDSGSDAIGGAEDDVGGLARSAGDGQHLFDGSGDLTAEFRDDLPGRSDDGFGFVVEEAC